MVTAPRDALHYSAKYKVLGITRNSTLQMTQYSTKILKFDAGYIFKQVMLNDVIAHWSQYLTRDVQIQHTD